MSLFKKIKERNGRRSIYFLDFKVFSYTRKDRESENSAYIKVIEEKLKGFSSMGVDNNSGRSPRLIVSLTSFPARMNSIHTCLYSLLTQTLKPDMVILWLADENFPNRERDIPEKVLNLQKNGLSIKWCNDIRSYKKLIPTLRQYPNEIIVTADDDLIYASSWLEKLYDNFLKYPKDIQVHRITRFEFNQEWVTMGKEPYDDGSFLNKLTGGAGALYPPSSLCKDVLNEELFSQLAPTNDDQWFWFQAILNNVKIRIVANNESNLIYTEDSQDVGLFNINDHGPNLFWKDFERLIEYYPEAEQKMLQEWEKRSSSR